MGKKLGLVLLVTGILGLAGSFGLTKYIAKNLNSENYRTIHEKRYNPGSIAAGTGFLASAGSIYAGSFSLLNNRSPRKEEN